MPPIYPTKEQERDRERRIKVEKLKQRWTLFVARFKKDGILKFVSPYRHENMARGLFAETNRPPFLFRSFECCKYFLSQEIFRRF